MLTKTKIKGMLTIGEISRVDGSDLQDLLDLFMGNLAISTPILRIIREILSKEFRVNNIETGDVEQEITTRIKGIEGFEDYIYNLAFLPFGEFTLHEVVYGNSEYNPDMRIMQLNELPNKYVSYDIENFKSSNGWYYENEDGGEFAIKPDEFITSIYGANIDFPMGKGLFRYGVEQAFEDLDTTEAQLRALRQKYGGLIPVFAYDPAEYASEKGREKLQQRVDSIREMSSANESVMGIPITDQFSGLSEGFQFIKLSDLSLDEHMKTTEHFEQKLETFLMGANFSSVDAGSNAKDEVQSNQKDKMTHHITRIICKEMKKLIVLDSQLFGYDPNVLKVEMNDTMTEKEEVEFNSRKLSVEKQDNDLLRDRANSIQSAVQTVAYMKFNGIPDPMIAELLHLEITFVTPIKAKDMEVKTETSKTVGKE